MNVQEALDIVSYKFGAKKGSTALDDSFLNPSAIQQGIQDNQQGCLKKIAARDYMQAMKIVQAERLLHAKKLGENFLKETSVENDVTTTPSGLLYRVLQQGDGDMPTLDSTVSVHYHGCLIDGSVFESSVERNQPASFRLAKVIDGWKEALQLMPVGSRYQLFVPEYLAYGERGAGSKIPPFSTLVFEVELLAIECA